MASRTSVWRCFIVRSTRAYSKAAEAPGISTNSRIFGVRTAFSTVGFTAFKSALGKPIAAYAEASRAWPLPVAFATCWVKGCGSDLVTQKAVEHKAEVDWRRNLAFATFSGAYLGCGQHYIYNTLFTRWFGAALDVPTALKKVVTDGLWHVPMVYLPLYYMFEDTVLRDGPLAGLKRYSNEWLDCMKPYWSMWTFFHFANFRFTPPELRIGLIACMSFLWLVVLSYVSHASYEAEKKEQRGA